MGEQRGSRGEHRGSKREYRGSERKQRESISPKQALTGEQSGGTLVSERSRVSLGSGMLYIHIYYIYSELRIEDCLSRSRRGAGPP